MAKHTDGPWEVALEMGLPIITTRKGKVVAETLIAQGVGALKDNSGLRDEIAANARLIAAAPQLLEALKAIVQESDEANGGKGAKLPIVLYMRELAAAAIALAEAGE